jgi:hypothetical protein
MNNREIEELRQSWQAFYQDLFEISIDYSRLNIPAYQSGFDRLLIIAQGMSSERLYHKYREFFMGWKSTNKNLDDVVQSDRSSKDSSYAVWCQETVEADPGLQNLSAAELKARGIACMTLEERLLFELKYYKEGKWHLDPDTFTLCAGSRYTDGYVPTVRYRVTAVGLGIHWYDAQDRFPAVRARQVVI